MNDPLPAACAICKGACCEGVAIDPVKLGFSADMLRWWRLHGEPSAFGTWIPQPCRLLKDGLCSEHTTRPQLCRDWAVGGKMCRQAVKERRPMMWRTIFEVMP